jgi:ribosomal protein L11 methyltransferase
MPPLSKVAPTSTTWKRNWAYKEGVALEPPFFLTTMSWNQIHIQVETEQVEQLSELLNELGAAAVTVQDAADQPIYEPPPGATPMWEQSIVTGLFSDELDSEQLITALKSGFSQQVEYRLEPLPEQDWERSWMDDFQPMRFGQHLWIVPTWHEAPDVEAVNIKLDPGLAFGTGTHATTALCLEWLDAHPPQGKQVIDYGCGSGILGIAALLLGAEQVIGIDNDPQALQASRDNAEQNGVADRLQVLMAGNEASQVKSELLIANILAQPLIELAPQLAEQVIPGGAIVLSGILAEQADDVLKAYQAWFEMQPPVQREDWIRLEGRRK